MECNFFWKGNQFSFINYICVLSHIKAGHTPVIWTSGDVNNIYYSKLQNNNSVIIKNADDIVNVDKFINRGGNFRTASAFWRFIFLYKFGGLYCDVDAYALKHFPDDDWIIAGGGTDIIYNGVIKTPPGCKLFVECVNNIKYNWGNVEVFSAAYKNYFGEIPHHYDKLFYPYSWDQHDKLFQEIEIPEDCYSIHLWGKMIEDASQNIDESYCKPSLLLDLIQNVRELI
jgi:hypothetical protein